MKSLIHQTILLFLLANTTHAAAFAVYTAWPFDTTEARRRQQETAEVMNLPVNLVVRLPGDIPLALVLIPAGKAILGNPQTDAKFYENEMLHHYTRSVPQYVSKYHITREQYKAVMGAEPTATEGGTGPKYPAIVWYDDIVSKVIPALEKYLPAGMRLRIPSGDEWEYACRAGVPNGQYFTLGNTESDLARGAWYSANSGGAMHDVGLKLPNGWGLYDMQGNAWQYEGGIPGWDATRTYRLGMGGSYGDTPWYNGIRISNEWGLPYLKMGFRLFADATTISTKCKTSLPKLQDRGKQQHLHSCTLTGRIVEASPIACRKTSMGRMITK